jgi:lipoprotein-releasing system ATP-binding protein
MSSTKPVVIQADEVWKSYDQGRVPVLRGVSLQVSRGERVALWGASGSGKSTLLHLLGGLDSPERGTLSVNGLNPAAERDRLALRRHHVGFVFQLHNLIADLTLEENLMVPFLAVNQDRASSKARISELLERLAISHRRRNRVQDLSGGERQRAAIARALAHRPAVILADEPTGSLDEQAGENVFEMLRQVALAENVSVVLATHERRFALACDRMLHLRNGVVVDE